MGNWNCKTSADGKYSCTHPPGSECDTVRFTNMMDGQCRLGESSLVTDGSMSLTSDSVRILNENLDETVAAADALRRRAEASGASPQMIQSAEQGGAADMLDLVIALEHDSGELGGGPRTQTGPGH